MKMNHFDEFSRNDYNPAIPDGVPVKLKELNLLPRSERNLRQRFDEYAKKDELLETNAILAREIVRKNKDIKFGDLLTEDQKRVIREISNQKRKEQTSEPDFISFDEVIEDLENEGIPIWLFKTSDHPHGSKESLYCSAARTYWWAVQLGHIDNDGRIVGDSDYPDDHLRALNKTLREFKQWIPQNPYDELKYELLDKYCGFTLPPPETYLEKKLLEQVGLYPYDPVWAVRMSTVGIYGVDGIEEYYRIAEEIAERTGVSFRIFRVVERYYNRQVLKEFEPKRNRLTKPFFLITYVLKKKYPKVYKYYRTRVDSFLDKDLLGLQEKKEIKKLQKERKDLGAEAKRPTTWPTYTPDATGFEGDARVETAVMDGSAVWQKQDQLDDAKLELKRVEHKLHELNVKREIRIREFISLLKNDFLLGCIFYTYVLNGFEKLKLKKESHRPADKTIGKIIVHLCDKLDPYKEKLQRIIEENLDPMAHEDHERANLYCLVHRLLGKLTGGKTRNIIVKKYYHRYKK